MLGPLVALCFASVVLPNSVLAVGRPFGQAAGTTGGGSAKAATPSSLTELTSWLSDSTARVIVLDRIFDFTSIEGTAKITACKPWTCSPNAQLALDTNSWCSNYYPNAAKTTVTYNKAGLNPLKVGSNKTLLGKGSNAGMVSKGKGLKIAAANNIIIQNIKITDINAQYVWGGDAIQIDGGSNIWIDHNYVRFARRLERNSTDLRTDPCARRQFQNIARQMVVTGYNAVTKTTFSNNVFNGETAYSVLCNGQHYWVALFTGKGDQLTFAYNYLYKTSGRGPHVGTGGYSQNVHLYNNYFVSVDGHAIDAQVGSKVLLEGNYFNKVSIPVQRTNGQAYAPVSSTEVAACSATIGRKCVANVNVAGGALPGVASDAGTLKGFTDSVSKGATVMAASGVGSYVQANAGVGKVN